MDSHLDLEINFMKEDVLSFGIVLLELLIKNGASEIVDLSAGDRDECIKRIVNECSSDYYDRIDKSLSGQGFDGEIYELLEVAFECVESIPGQRPTMVQVYQHASKWLHRNMG